MREDGDLQRWTRVDVLPPDGMQEVSGSSPLSSTGQKQNSNRSNRQYSTKVQQRRPIGPPYVCSDRACSPGRGCWQDSGFQTLNWRWSACHLRKWRCHRARDSCHRVPTRPPIGPFQPVTVAAFPSGLAALVVPAGPIHSQDLRPPGQSRGFADGRLGARARRADGVCEALGGLVRCAAQARGCAVARLCAPVGTRVCHVRNRRAVAHGT